MTVNLYYSTSSKSSRSARAWLVEKPQLLKRPIIYDGRRLQIGYNEEDIRAFLPRSVRKSELREIQQKLYDDDQQAVG